MALINATTNMTDTDLDGLPDNVELVLGTNWNNSDSDFDRIGDYEEIMAGSDAMSPDSNLDGLPDYFEMDNVTIDIDWDGVPNIWDWDNDGDGVSDSFDISPNARIGTAPSFELQLETTGVPTYLSFQIRSARPETMSFYLQKWDWPNNDYEGVMRDMDNSKEDVSAVPMLELNCSYLPDPAELEGYGITVSGTSAFVPILPVIEFGEVVALKGKMFLPGDGTNKSISVKARLVWAIMGKTDIPQKAIQANDGLYLTCAPGGTIVTTDTVVTASSTLDYLDLENGRFAMRAPSGKYLSLGADGQLGAWADNQGDAEIFKIINYTDNVKIQTRDGRYLTEMMNGTIYATVDYSTPEQRFKIQDMGYRPQNQMLVQYYEDFSVVGFSAEESHGADVSIISSGSWTQILAAQLKLAYFYLRNSTEESGDISGILDSTGITANIMRRVFNHTDEAMGAICSDMLPAVLDSLPPDMKHPVIVAMEEKYASLDMSEYWIGYRPPGGQLAVNIAAKQVLTTRSLRMCWYDTTDNTLLDEEAIVSEIIDLGISEESQTVLIGLALAWHVGETFLIRIDIDEVNYDISELDMVSDTVGDIIFNSIDSICALHFIYMSAGSAYNAFFFNFMEDIMKHLCDGSYIPKYTTWTKQFEALEKVKFGKLAAVGRVIKVIEIVGIVLAVGLAIWAMIEIGNQLGWTATGTAIAIIYFILETAIAIGLFALGAAFPIGTILALALTIADIIISIIWGSGLLQQFILGIVNFLVWLFSDIRVRSEVSLDPIGVDVSYADSDSNGIDVGDKITYTTRFYSNVTITGHGSSSDLADSYLVPDFTVSAPWGSAAQTWSNTTSEPPVTTSTKKSTIYETSATIVPDKPMANFPMAIGLSTDYKVYYDDCWFWLFSTRESQSGSSTADWTTIYTDVMPATIYDFADWSALTSNDPDGDGLTSSEEQANGTNPWRWDTDGDGLGDKYELQIGTNPLSSDSDGDGLNDFYEFTTGSDAWNMDTDGDGLSDFTEYVGYAVSIEFCNQTFHRLVNSDPTQPDTDGDGLDDYIEWMALLNPRTSDTNGDWENDKFTGYWIGEMTYAATLEFPAGWTAQVTDAKVTPEGDIIVAFTNCDLIKFAPNGSILWIKSVAALDELGSIFVGKDGDIYASGNDYFTYHNLALYDRDMHFIKSAWVGGKLCTVDEEEGIIYSWSCDDIGVYAHDIDTWDELYRWPNSGNMKFGMDILSSHDLIAAEECWAGESYEYCVCTYTSDGEMLHEFGSHGSEEGQFIFDSLTWHPESSVIDVLTDDFIVVTDTGNNRVQMFAPNGRFLGTFGTGPGSDDDNFDYPRGIDHDDEHLYVVDRGNNRVQVLNYRLFMNNTILNVTFVDADGDGLTDANETKGWNITVTRQVGGTSTYHVTSEPNVTDTDSDGLNDTREFNLGCDPRLVDTDGDGLSDAEEARLGTDPTHWDTDGDGLDDATELTFLSDPKLADTDGDGLNDGEEFGFGSNPIIDDSDLDGLDDMGEKLLGTDPNNPDSDRDFMLDGEEGLQGTNPNDGDSDGDGLSDGYESLYGTGPLNPDSDGDGLSDGFETSRRMNPLSNDTDGDGVLDGEELERGLNPFSRDTDGDGVPDNLDTDYLLVLNDDIILVADEDDGLNDFVLALSKEANVIFATPQELVENYSAEPNIVLVGRPDAPPGTAGAVIGEVLDDTGDVIEGMLRSEIRHRAVRYGVWTPTQTVIMLSGIHSQDSHAVLGIFKSQKVTKVDNSITFQYLNARSSFLLEDMDTTKVTDSVVRAKLDDMSLFNVTVSRYNSTNAPANLTHQAGLEVGEASLGKYLEIEVDENVKGSMMGARIELYYTVEDLDMTGDGDTDDPEDIDETSLALYLFDPDSGNWTKLSPNLGWVNDTGVNTTDIMRYGTQYLGFIWADVTHLSLYGVAGKNTAVLQLPVACAGDMIQAHVDDLVSFDASLSSGNGPISNYTWTFQHDNGTVNLFGPAPTFTFRLVGTYPVTLRVIDSFGLTATGILPVHIMEKNIPISRVGSLPYYTNSLTFDIPYTSICNIYGDEIASVGLYWRYSTSGAWRYYGSFTTSPISFTATGGGIYQFFTLATDIAGNQEPMKTAAEASTIIDLGPPLAPTNLGERINDDGTSTLTWAASPSMDRSHYNIYVSTDPYNFDFTIPYATTAGTSWVHPDGGNETIDYFYIVRTVDIAGNEEANSNAVGKFVAKLNPGWNLFSSPLIPPDCTVAGIFGNGLTGGTAQARSDRIFSWDGAKWRVAYYYDDGMGSTNWLFVGGSFSIQPDRGYWIYILEDPPGSHPSASHPPKAITITGAVPGARSVALSVGWNLVGYCNLRTVTLQNGMVDSESGLLFSGFRGGASQAESDKVFSWDGSKWAVQYMWENGDAWDGTWLGATFDLVSGKGYWIYVVHEPFTWTYG
jgi:hypothetical protein